MTAAAACWRLVARGNTVLAAQAFAAGAVLLTVGVFSLGTARADRHQHSDVLLSAIRERSRRPEIATLGRLEPSWVFYAGQPLRAVEADEIAGGEHGFFAPGRERFVITTREVLEGLDLELPQDVGVLAEAPYFLKRERLVVLGRFTEPISTAARPEEGSSSR